MAEVRLTKRKVVRHTRSARILAGLRVADSGYTVGGQVVLLGICVQ